MDPSIDKSLGTVKVMNNTENKSINDLPEGILTPETTPTKDKEKQPLCEEKKKLSKKVLEKTLEKKGESQQDGLLNNDEENKEPGDKRCVSREMESPKPPHPKLIKATSEDKESDTKTVVVSKTKKGRGGRPRGSKKKPEDGSNAASQTLKPQSSKNKAAEKKKPMDSNNHLMTDFFPVRRSSRMCQSLQKKEQQLELEKAILSGQEDGLKVEEIEGKGRGVVSTKPFRRGDFVVEYTGDLVDLGTAKQREKNYSLSPEFGCYMYYFNHNNRNYCVDATAESGKLGRLLNHSKYGNCATKVVGVGNRPYLILVAAKDIKVGEELLYDYGDRSKESLAAHPWLAL